MILFHHRALIGCRAWICTKSVGVKTRYAAVTPRGNELARRAKAQQAEAGARGRVRTRTGDALDVVPLLVGLHERNLEPPPGMDFPSPASQLPK